MPIFGGYKPTTAGLTVVKELGQDRIDIENAQTLTFTFEVLAEPAIARLPAALHPPFPPYCSLVVRACEDGPYGPFTTAELRLHARATNHYVGYVLGGFTDNDRVAAWLANAYGDELKVAETVSLKRRHYGFEAKVISDGRAVLDAVVDNPGFIAGVDVLHVQNSVLAAFDGAPVLIAEEFEYQIKEARRGFPHYHALDVAAFGAPTLAPSNHLPTTWVAGTWSYMPVRFLMDPTKPAAAGTRKVGQPAAV
ncbi:MAG TPA: hypothetical protein VN806_13160 [Caulobacteraceae bacterium]|nr:hypothetical protein [Caulobacteraceae bacterium]